MENILVAGSNFGAIKVIQSTLLNDDYITYIVVSYVAVASFISHLFENHKHGMPGWYLSPEVSYLLELLGVTGVILTVTRFCYLYYINYGLTVDVLKPHLNEICVGVFGIFFNLLSEHDKYNKELKAVYIISHMLWHMIIFEVMNYFYIVLFTKPQFN